MNELYVVYVGERLDRTTVGIATSLDGVHDLVCQATESGSYGMLASECVGYEGPFQADVLFR